MFEMIPFRKNNNLSSRGDLFDEMFNNFFSDNFLPSSYNMNSFKVDVKETDDSYMVEADLPGMKKENIALDYDNNYLTISAKREDNVENKDKDNNYVRRERRYGEFKRTFFIDNINESGIDASFKDGVLNVTLPKLNKGMDTKKRIDIH